MTKVQSILAQNMKSARRKTGLSQTQLAEKAGTATNYISQIECGKRFPSPQMLEQIAVALGIEDFELFSVKSIESVSMNELLATVKNGLDKTLQEIWQQYL
jgi:transcriptional regulator with XRE-family HTH domain